MSSQNERPQISREKLEARIKVLEEQTRFTLDVLDMATTLGDFQTDINKLQTSQDILRETAERISGFINFRAKGFYLVDEKSSDFALTLCEPGTYRDFLKAEVENLIESGIFSLAVRESRAMTVYSMDKKHRLVLHVLSTSSRTRGMFVGILHLADRNVSSMVLSLLSIVLKSCANAIESFELYRLLRENELRYRELADALPLTVFETDQEGKLKFVNSTVRAQFGHEPDEVSDRMLISELAMADDRPRIQEWFEQRMALGGGGRIACQAVRKDGSLFRALVQGAPIISHHRCVGLRGIVVDLEDS